MLIVFLNAGGGGWTPNRVAKQLPHPLHFAAVWVVGLQYVEAGEYVYSVTELNESEGNSFTWRIRILRDFDSWAVSSC